MSKYKIFVDGSSGTTGLRIADRLAGREEFTLLTIPEADRKDVHARAAVINQSDLSFLCLPDAAARRILSGSGVMVASMGVMVFRQRDRVSTASKTASLSSCISLS